MKITELRNHEIGVEEHAGQNGEPDFWRMTFTDKNSGDVMWLAFQAPVRDHVVRMLTGSGVIVPAMAIPRGKPIRRG